MQMPNSKNKCTYCKDYFSPKMMIRTPAGLFCSIEHACSYGKEKDLRIKLKPWTTPKIKRAKTKKDYADIAQKEFNAFIRLRDKKLPCISCGTTNDIQYHAGHFKSRGAHPELRFDQKNCHKQCVRCNNFLSGNIEGYIKGLNDRYGPSIVIYLNKHHPMKKYSIDDYKKIAKEYRLKIKEAKF